MKRRSFLAAAASAVLAAGCVSVSPSATATQHPALASAHRHAPTNAATTHATGQRLALDLELDLASEDEASAGGVGDLARVPGHCNVDAVQAAGGSIEAALAACERDLEVELEVGANAYPSRARKLQSVARRLDRAGDAEGAREAYDRAIAADRYVGEAAASATALAKNHLALLDRADGNIDRAREQLQWVIDNTTDAATLGAARHNLGLVLLDAGELDAAEAELVRARGLLSGALGEHHASVGNCQHSLGVVLAERGALDESVEAFRAALAIRETALTAPHPLTAETHTSLGVAYAQQGDLDGALASHRAALAIDAEVLGPQHETTAVDHAHIGSTLIRLGKHEAAGAAFERALAILEATRPDDDPEVQRLRVWIEVAAGQNEG